MSEIIDRISGLISELGDVSVPGDEGLILVEVPPTRATVQVLELVDGLTVATVGQLVAVDLPNSPDLAGRLEKIAEGLSFGSLLRSAADGEITDVVQRYTFPIDGLDDLPLLTMFHLVLSAGVEAAVELA